MDIIDIHVHPVARRNVRDARNLRIFEHSAQCLADESPVPMLLERMDRAGIMLSCLMGPNPWDGIDLTNEDVHRMVQSHAGRFIGFLGVDPGRQEARETRHEIQRAVREWEFRGVGEIGGGDILAPEWNVVYETCIELDIPILVHVGICLPTMLLRHSHPFVIDDLAHRYPALTIIAAHVGVPWVLETIAVAVRHPNVHVDISAIPAFHRMLVRPVVAMCVDRGLEDRILFGSDFPVVDPCAYAESIRKLKIAAPLRWLFHLPKISADVRQKVLSANARRLLRLEPSGSSSPFKSAGGPAN